jgi:hypothetical protein
VARAQRILVMVLAFVATIWGVGLLVAAVFAPPHGWLGLMAGAALLLAAGFFLYTSPKRWRREPTHVTEPDDRES